MQTADHSADCCKLKVNRCEHLSSAVQMLHKVISLMQLKH